LLIFVVIERIREINIPRCKQGMLVLPRKLVSGLIPLYHTMQVAGY
jgi:hypothetical protein